MVRLAIIIVVLAGIAAALVHLRREEARIRYEIQAALTRQTTLRRRLWDQRVRIARLVAPGEVRKRAEELALDLIDEEESLHPLADRRGESAAPSGGQ